MKKLMILALAVAGLIACKNNTETEKTTITTETTKETDALTDETGTTVTKTVETDTTEVSVSVGKANPQAIDTISNRRR